MPESTSPEFEALLAYLKRTRGFDFTAYKRASLMRRIEKRMQLVDVDNFTAYVDYLEVDADEFTALFNTILINVTGFFRDPVAWEYIASDIMPFLCAARATEGPIRMWSAACASGEEAYTLAMVAAEYLGVEAARQRVKIYATDADDEALTQARAAVYTTQQIKALPEGLAENYFARTGDHWTFHNELRRNIIFGRHDLVQDAPISRIDLLVCRNALMYFNSETQGRVLARFHFALNEGGVLLLGKSETLLTHGTLFSPVNIRRRIFAKVPRGTLRERLTLLSQAQSAGEPIVEHLVNHARVREAAADAMPTAQFIVEPNGQLLQINAEARSMFGLSSKDVGRRLSDLEVSYRPVELRSLVERAHTELKPQSVREIDWPVVSTGEFRCIDVEVVPLRDSGGQTLGTSISFIDVSSYRELQAELQQANHELETTLEELQSTNEELETTNEELQSTVEELETTNEELQSTNEELETMNEELQSTNEELQTINDESRLRSEELHEVNVFLESILTSLPGAVALLTKEMAVQVWNVHAENMWGLRLDEVQGRHLMNLDFGLPVAELTTPIRACLSGESAVFEAIFDATNRRGRAIRCRISVTPLQLDTLPDAEIRGAILVMHEV